MKRSAFALIAALCGLFLFSSFTSLGHGKKVPQTKSVYIFGIAASFTDSTVFFTTIQSIDSVKLQKKTHFLPLCASYSYQLKDYLEKDKGEFDRVCSTFSAETREKAEKKYLDLKRKYSSQKNLIVVYLSEADFKYKRAVEEPEEVETEEVPDSTASR